MQEECSRTLRTWDQSPKYIVPSRSQRGKGWSARSVGVAILGPNGINGSVRPKDVNSRYLSNIRLCTQVLWPLTTASKPRGTPYVSTIRTSLWVASMRYSPGTGVKPRTMCGLETT